MKPLITTYSPQQVSDLLGLPKSTVLSAIERGELPAIRFNARVYRITAIDAGAWFAAKGGRLKSTTSTTPTTPQRYSV
jgi:excisionase family DNA binding protein